MSQTNEHLSILGEERGQRGVCAGDNFGGQVVQNTIVDVDVPEVIHGRGCVHRRELVEGGDLQIYHTTSMGATGRGGMERAIEERGLT